MKALTSLLAVLAISSMVELMRPTRCQPGTAPHTSLKRRVANGVVFSAAGTRVFSRVAPILKRSYNLVVNNNLTPTVNGEYWLISRFSDGSIFVDVGYHRGDWSNEVVLQNPNARVIAFDPWIQATKYFRDNGIHGKVELYPLGLADQVGKATFYDYENACNSLALRDLEVRSTPTAYEIDVTTLDAWTLEMGVEHIDFVKVDVEGYDLPVLKGARRLLSSQSIGAFAFEYGSGWIASRQFLGEAARYIAEMGYHLCKLFPGFVVPFDYEISYETFAGAMYVGLSEELWGGKAIPRRDIRV